MPVIKTIVLPTGMYRQIAGIIDSARCNIAAALIKDAVIILNTFRQPDCFAGRSHPADLIAPPAFDSKCPRLILSRNIYMR